MYYLPSEIIKYFIKKTLNIQKAFYLVQSIKNHQSLINFVLNHPSKTKMIFQKIQNQDIKWLQRQIQKVRDICPRAYFISNDDVIQILKPFESQKFLSDILVKLTQGVQELQFNQLNQIIALKDNIGFKLNLLRKIQTKEKQYYEVIIQLISQMKRAVHYDIKKAIKSYSLESFIDWFKKFSYQSIYAVDQIIHTQKTEKAIQKRTLSEYTKQRQNFLQCLTKIMRYYSNELTKSQVHKLSSLITQIVHNCKVLNQMKSAKTSNIKNLYWVNNIRHYWRNNELQIQCGKGVYKYQYEFIGSPNKLVITQQTEKIYQTIFNSWEQNMFVSPQGKAGTGKTETIKDLSNIIGQFCVVINCSDQIDHVLFEKFILGMKNSGCWICCDEFNRIDVNTLREIYKILINVCIQKDKNVNSKMENKNIKDYFLAFTMNPGYAGRTTLPSQYYEIVRGISIQAPDYELIMQVLFHQKGFFEAKSLSKKLKKIFICALNNFSKQDFYDFGMRAILSILNYSGILLQQTPQIQNQNVIVVEALENIKFKLVKEDIYTFNHLIKDIFNCEKMFSKKNEQFKKCVIQVIKEQRLILNQNFIEKVIQVFISLNNRHGNAIIGEPLSGRSTVLKVLKKSLEKYKKISEIKVHTIYPKAENMASLYGYLNQDTKQWVQGRLSSVFRKTIQQKDDQHWIVFKGELDALWIESMNTVLDDNKVLVLANGQRLPLNHNVRIIFEILNAQAISPATVSRLGIVYIPKDLISTEDLFENWIEKNSSKILSFEKSSQILKIIFKNIYKPIANYVIAHSLFNQNHIYKSFSTILSYLLEDSTQLSNDQCIRKLFVYDIVLSLGNLLDQFQKIEFNHMLLEILQKNNMSSIAPSKIVFTESKLNLSNWQWQSFDIKSKENFFFTPNLAQIQYILQLLTKNNVNIMFTGQNATRKTTFLKYLSKKQNQSIKQSLFNLSYEKNRNLFENWMKQSQKIFIDDWQKYQRECYGQIFMHNLFLQNIFCKKKSNHQVIAAMNYNKQMAKFNNMIQYFYPIYFSHYSKKQMKFILRQKLKQSQLVNQIKDQDEKNAILQSIPSILIELQAELKFLPNYDKIRSFNILDNFLSSNKKYKATVEQLLKTFIFEIMREIYDNMIYKTQTDTFWNIFEKQIQKHFPNYYFNPLEINLSSTLHNIKTLSINKIESLAQQDFMKQVYDFPSSYYNLENLVYHIMKEKNLLIISIKDQMTINFVKLGCSMVNLNVFHQIKIDDLSIKINQIQNGVLIVYGLEKILSTKQRTEKAKKAIKELSQYISKNNKKTKIVFLFQYQEDRQKQIEQLRKFLPTVVNKNYGCLVLKGKDGFKIDQ